MNSLNKTFLPTKNYKSRNWFIIDCKGQKLGRLATIIVALLKGKVKPHYHPSIDMGDYIILVNADSIILNEDSKHYIVNKQEHSHQAQAPIEVDINNFRLTTQFDSTI